MSFLEVHPMEVEPLRRLGLAAAEDFLRLEGDIVGGHPDRHVLRIELESGAGYLKKEHRIRGRDRLAHWWRGAGWVSKSVREGRLLRQLNAAGIPCPQVIAHGEASGRAFLWVREETGFVELRRFLQDQPAVQLALAEALGRELARLHGAGFQHRDLYSKHVLVRRDDAGWRFCFLDWQRGRQTRRVRWFQRLYDLATLDATLADDLVSRRTRLLCWRTYLAAAGAAPTAPRSLLRTVCRLSATLQRKRRIRELRQPPLPNGQQNLIWLDGEALVVTRYFRERVTRVPEWLSMPAAPRQPLECVEMPGPGGAAWRLVRRFTSRPWRWLASWWRPAQFPAPEFEHAAALIRLERYGIEAPRLLALGHRTLRPWQKQSFLLTESPADTASWRSFLESATPQQRRRMLRDAGRCLRRIHEAGYACRGHGFDGWAVRPDTGAVVLSGVEGLQRRRTTLARLGRQCFRRLARIAWPELSASDRLRFYLGYHALDHLTNEARQTARALQGRRPKTTPSNVERRVA